MVSIEEIRRKTQQRTRRIDHLLIKYRMFRIFKKKGFLPIRDPILLLHRVNGDIDTIEGAPSGWFKFKHSNGKDATIHLNPDKLYDWHHGGATLKTWSHHEDNAFSYPQKPLVYAEELYDIYTKMINDEKMEQASMIEGIGKGIWWVGGAIAIVLLVLIFGGLVGVPLLTKKETVVQPQTISSSVPIVLGILRNKLRR